MKEQENLVPAGMTEFAKDKTFGYKSSDLTEYVEEKTEGKYKKQDCITISLEELKKDLETCEKSIFLVGDGANLCYNTLSEAVPRLVLPPAHLIMQRASGVALAAEKMAERGLLQSPGELEPNYLRLSQAERERLEKLKQSKGD